MFVPYEKAGSDSSAESDFGLFKRADHREDSRSSKAHNISNHDSSEVSVKRIKKKLQRDPGHALI